MEIKWINIEFSQSRLYYYYMYMYGHPSLSLLLYYIYLDIYNIQKHTTHLTNTTHTSPRTPLLRSIFLHTFIVYIPLIHYFLNFPWVRNVGKVKTDNGNKLNI